MVVEIPVEDVRKLKAQVVELQHERASGQKTDDSRAQKARTLLVSIPALDVRSLHGVVGGSSRATNLMQSFNDAEDTTLKDVRSA